MSAAQKFSSSKGALILCPGPGASKSSIEQQSSIARQFGAGSKWRQQLRTPLLGASDCKLVPQAPPFLQRLAHTRQLNCKHHTGQFVLGIDSWAAIQVAPTPTVRVFPGHASTSSKGSRHISRKKLSTSSYASSSEPSPAKATSNSNSNANSISNSHSSFEERLKLLEASEDDSRDTEWLAEDEAWRIRSAQSGEVKDIAEVQARAFHEKPALAFLEKATYTMLKAEIMDTLLRMRALPNPGKYFSLVAVPKADNKAEHKVGSRDMPRIVGTVDLLVLEKEDVLRFAEGVTEYLYLSGMAVHVEYKRQGIGALLLKGVEAKARSLGFRCIALQVYLENETARALYEKSGFKAVYMSSAWAPETILPGTQGKRRILMLKYLHYETPDDGSEVPN